MNRIWTMGLALFCVVVLRPGMLPGSGDEEKSSRRASQLDAAKKKLVNAQEFELKHKYAANETLQWKVTHLATTETTIGGNTQTSKSSSISTKVWKVKEVDAAGNMKIVHAVGSVDMWQSISGRQEVRYNSEKDETAPAEYEAVAATVGKPLATVTITPAGGIVHRESGPKSHNFGVGDLVLPLPEGKVKLGAQWFVPSEIMVRVGEDRQTQKIKTRLAYTLDKVQTGVATISVQTQVLTPVNDPRIQSQLAQQLTTGTIKFDMDAGRLLSKQIDWDETIIGFNGPDSTMKYLARFTEEAVASPVETARKPD